MKIQTIMPMLLKTPARQAGVRHPSMVELTPAWALQLVSKRKPADKGMGDIIAREIGWKGDAKFESWFKETFGRTCKGDWSLNRVNLKWPLTG
jgi:hypothetical protein